MLAVCQALFKVRYTHTHTHTHAHTHTHTCIFTTTPMRYFVICILHMKKLLNLLMVIWLMRSY